MSLLLLASLACRAPEPAEPVAEAELLARARTELAEVGLDPLRLGLVAPTAHGGDEEAWAPVAAHLAEGLGVRVELRHFASMEGLEDALLAGVLEIVPLPPVTYVMLSERRSGPRVVATPVVNGLLHGQSVVFALPESGVQGVARLSDLGGGAVALGTPASAAGFLYPMLGMLRAGLDPWGRELSLLEEDSAIYESVARGKSLVGAVDAHVFSQGEAHPEAGTMRAVAKGGPIPNEAWCLAPQVPDGVDAALLVLLGELRGGPGGPLAGVVELDGFVPAQDADYAALREDWRTLEQARRERSDGQP